MKRRRESVFSIIRGRPCRCGSRQFHEQPVGPHVVQRTCKQCGRSQTVPVKYPPRDEDVELVSLDTLFSFSCEIDEPDWPQVVQFRGVHLEEERSAIENTEAIESPQACENTE